MGQGDKAVLVIHEGERKGQRWYVQGDLMVLGRGSECDLVLPERQVSRQHIKIKFIDGTYFLEDLESKNGTWVNGHKLTGETRLKDGDEINIAMAVKFIFAESEATAPMSSDQIPPGLGLLRLDRESRRVFVGDREVDPP